MLRAEITRLQALLVSRGVEEPRPTPYTYAKAAKDLLMALGKRQPAVTLRRKAP
jgi:hypothetical protein